jgi:inosine-uridine nucleoside N-ribohydrolase
MIVKPQIAFRNGIAPLQRTLFVDTDVGFDDILAISLLNSSTSTTTVPCISTVGGVLACPIKAANFLEIMTPSNTLIIPGKSQVEKEMTPPSWMTNTRNALDQIVIESSSKSSQKETTSDSTITKKKIPELLLQYPDNSVDLLCLGPLSNLASWVDEDLLVLERKLNEIWIMGGNLSNAKQQEAEFNFSQDPKATWKVLNCSQLKEKLYIVSAQTCEVSLSQAHQQQWERLTETAKRTDSVLSRVLEVNSTFGALKYDTLCAFSYANSDFGSLQKIECSVDEETGLLAFPCESNANLINFATDIDVDLFFDWLETSIIHNGSTATN